jgi:hypothetical protein
MELSAERWQQAQEIASALGAGWTARPGDEHTHRAYLEGPDDECLRLDWNIATFDGPPALGLKVRGVLPDRLMRYDPDPRDSDRPLWVAGGVPPEQLADAIVRQVLRGGYLSRMSVAKEKALEAQRGSQARSTAVKDLEAVLGHESADAEHLQVGRRGEAIVGEATVAVGVRVHFDLSALSATAANRLAVAIVSINKKVIPPSTD